MTGAALKQAIRETIVQPPFLFLLILEAALVGLIVFGIGVEFEDGVLVSLKIFGTQIEPGEVAVLSRELVQSVTEISTGIIMFLLILAGSFLFSEFLHSPLLGIVLTKPLSRRQLFLARFSGLMFAIFIDLLLVGLSITAIFSLKSGGAILPAPFLLSLSLWLESFVILSFCTLMATLMEQATAVALVGLATYFILAPFLRHAKQSDSLLLEAAAYLFPPMGELAAGTRGLPSAGEIALLPVEVSLVYAFAYLLIASSLFHRRDIQ